MASDPGRRSIWLPVLMLVLVLLTTGLVFEHGISSATVAARPLEPPEGDLDTTFDPGTGANEEVVAVALQGDGKVVIGGYFTSINSTSRNRIARLNADGSLDTSFDPGSGTNLAVRVVVPKRDGDLMIGGLFTTMNNTSRNRIARLNADGSLDTSFNPGLGANSTIYAMVLQDDGKVLIGGGFTRVDDVERHGIARLNADGSLDTSFDPGSGTNGTVYAMALQDDGKVLIGGGFTNVNGVSRSAIARLNADGSVDSTFDPGIGVTASTAAFVFALALQEDGKVVIGGSFTGVNNVERHGIARLNTDGSLDTSFNPDPGTDGVVYIVIPLENGQVLAGGDFTNMNNTALNFLARLNSDGSLDTNFNTGTGPNDWIAAIAVQSDGKLVIGGYFTSVNGTGRNRIARLLASAKPLPTPTPLIPTNTPTDTPTMEPATATPTPKPATATPTPEVTASPTPGPVYMPLIMK